MSLSLTLVPIAIGAVSMVSYKMKEKLEDGTYYRLDTQMKDEKLLQKALENFGCEVTMKEDCFLSSVGELDLLFQQQENGIVSAYFHEQVEEKDAEQWLNNLYNEYTRLVQQQTYDKLLIRAKEEGLILEAENRREDDTIVLTFQVKEKLYE